MKKITVSLDPWKRYIAFTGPAFPKLGDLFSYAERANVHFSLTVFAPDNVADEVEEALKRKGIGYIAICRPENDS